MQPSTPASVHGVQRTDLLQRRSRIEAVLHEVGPAADLQRLVDEVDAAIRRYDTGTYGMCEVCDDAVGEAEINAAPLSRYCLCELSAEQLGRLDQDLELAWQIQSGLLPAPEVQAGDWSTHFRYVPAGRVGGDYVDVIETKPGEELFFLLGDVSGKGVAASVLMAHLHALVRSLVEPGADPAGILGRANEAFVQRILPAQYATLVCGRVDAEGTLAIANAGHLPPLLRRRHSVDLLPGAGVPIGLFESSRYETRHARIEAGESLFLYTDGLSETNGAGGDELGVEGVRAAVRFARNDTPVSLADDVLRTARASAGVAHDDLTVMVLQRG